MPLPRRGETCRGEPARVPPEGARPTEGWPNGRTAELGAFSWFPPDDEVFAFTTDLLRSVDRSRRNRSSANPVV